MTRPAPTSWLRFQLLRRSNEIADRAASHTPKKQTVRHALAKHARAVNIIIDNRIVVLDPSRPRARGHPDECSVVFSILQIPLHTNEKIPLTGDLVERVHFKPEVAMKSNDFVAPAQANEIGTSKTESQCYTRHIGTTRIVRWLSCFTNPLPKLSPQYLALDMHNQN